MTNAIAAPFIPKKSPSKIIPIDCEEIKIIEPTKTILLFSFPKSFEVYIEVIVEGIMEILTI